MLLSFDESLNYMILGVFIKYFRVKIVIGLSKNRCDLIITVGSSYIRWKSI